MTHERTAGSGEVRDRLHGVHHPALTRQVKLEVNQMIVFVFATAMIAFEMVAIRTILSERMNKVFGPAWNPTPEEFEARLNQYR